MIGDETARTPRTKRGERTRGALLDAALVEFGERGFQSASITSITQRAGTALGSFYTYFESKDEIFRAVLKDLSRAVGRAARDSLEQADGSLNREQAALTGFLAFAREHKEVYRIIDESEFVDPESYREHYETTAKRITARLEQGAEAGELRPDAGELHAWAIMGMNVFLGLRYAVWSEDADLEEVAAAARDLLERGLLPKGPHSAL